MLRFKGYVNKVENNYLIINEGEEEKKVFTNGFVTINAYDGQKRIPVHKELNKDEYLEQYVMINLNPSMSRSYIRILDKPNPFAKRPVLFSDKKTIFPREIKEGISFTNNLGFEEEIIEVNKGRDITKFVTEENLENSSTKINRFYELRSNNTQDSVRIGLRSYNPLFFSCQPSN